MLREFTAFDDQDNEMENPSSLESAEAPPIGDSTFGEFQATEISSFAPVRPKTSADLAAEVEDSFISLMKDKDYNTMMALTGEMPKQAMSLPEDFSSNFGFAFAQAVGHNAAVKWYSKLARIAGPENFRMEGDNLKLSISAKTFKKAVLPFLSDFNPDLREESPIVSLVLSTAENMQDQGVQDKMKHIMQYHNIDHGGEASFDVSQVEYGSEEGDIPKKPSTVFVNDNAPVGPAQPNQTDNFSIDITLKDLSNKAIAEYFVDNKVTDPSAIASKLSEEGFPRATVNEIQGIVKYMNLSDAMAQRKPKVVDGGDIDFVYDSGDI